MDLYDKYHREVMERKEERTKDTNRVCDQHLRGFPESGQPSNSNKRTDHGFKNQKKSSKLRIQAF